jgi:type I restriction enzyme M protein
LQFADETTALFNKWMKKNRARLSSLEVGAAPKALITALSEDLLAAFADSRLVDPYDIYQHLMTYWTETMQDDVYMIVTEGWQANAELIPPALVIARYFKQEQAAIETFIAEQEAINAQMEELNEEHGVDPSTGSGQEAGLLESAANEKGKITKASLKARVKELSVSSNQLSVSSGQLAVEDKDEVDLLNRYLQLIESAAEAGKKVKDAQKDLDEKVKAKYSKLKTDEIQTLVIDDKWLAAIAADINAEIQNVASTLANRIKELAERYTAPLPALTADVDTLTDKVDAHLKKMGFTWK